MKWVLSKIERTAACIIETIIYLRECFKTFSCYGIVEAALIIEGMRKCNVFKIKHIYFWWDGYSYICGSLLFCQQIIYATDRAEKNIFSKSCICFLQSICFFFHSFLVGFSLLYTALSTSKIIEITIELLL